MGIDHRVLQLRALPLEFFRNRLAGKFGQRLREVIAGVEPQQMIKTKIRDMRSGLQQIGRTVQRTSLRMPR